MRYTKLLFLSLIALLFFTGCSLSIIKGRNKPNAGFISSVDAGKRWKKLNAVPTITAETASIENLNILDIIMDPQDSKTLYLITAQGGFWYTYNQGNWWWKSNTFPAILVSTMTIDPTSKCTLYASSGSNIFKSTDCSRSWTQIYTDTRTATKVGVLQVDPLNSSTIYAGLSTGDLLISLDAGATWHTKHRFAKAIKQILIDSRNSDIMYIVTKDGLFKSTNKASEWATVEVPSKKFNGTQGIRRAYFDFSEDDTIYIITQYGLLYSTNGGEKWDRIKLITPPKSVIIRDFAINPKNNLEMYYTVDNQIYKSIDGGKNWETIELPTSSIITRLIINPDNPSILYAGLYFVEKK